MSENWKSQFRFIPSFCRQIKKSKKSKTMDFIERNESKLSTALPRLWGQRFGVNFIQSLEMNYCSQTWQMYHQATLFFSFERRIILTLRKHELIAWCAKYREFFVEFLPAGWPTTQTRLAWEVQRRKGGCFDEEKRMREKATKGISVTASARERCNLSFISNFANGKRNGGKRCGQKDPFAKNKLKTMVL